MRRIVTIFSFLLVFSVAGSALAASGDAQLLTPQVLADSPAAVALFHPNNARSLQLLDQLAVRSSGELLAVCVGAGCTAETTIRIAHQRDWPFQLAFDPTGDVSLDELGMRAAGSVASREIEPQPLALEQGLAAATGLPVSHAISSPLAQARQGTAAAAGALTPSPRSFGNNLTSRASREAPSVRDALFISVPLALVGIGGAALVFGARRRRLGDHGDDRSRSEPSDEHIEDYIRAKHGRKRTTRGA